MPAKKTWQMAIQLIVVASLFLACLSVVLPFASTAQDSLPWRGEYFDNQNLTGDPVPLSHTHLTLPTKRIV